MSRSSSPSDRADVYTRITAEIIAAIEAGAGECRLPWHHDGTSTARPTNVTSAKRYRGINTVALWVAAMTSGYGEGLWGTYVSGRPPVPQVRKGERATTVVLWKEVASTDDIDDGPDGDGTGRAERVLARHSGERHRPERPAHRACRNGSRVAAAEGDG